MAGILIERLGRKPSAILCSLPYVGGLLVSDRLPEMVGPVVFSFFFLVLVTLIDIYAEIGLKIWFHLYAEFCHEIMFLGVISI